MVGGVGLFGGLGVGPAFYINYLILHRTTTLHTNLLTPHQATPLLAHAARTRRITHPIQLLIIRAVHWPLFTVQQ